MSGILIMIPSKWIVDLFRFPNPSTPVHTVEPAILFCIKKSISSLCYLLPFNSSFLFILIVTHSIFNLILTSNPNYSHSKSSSCNNGKSQCLLSLFRIFLFQQLHCQDFFLIICAIDPQIREVFRTIKYLLWFFLKIGLNKPKEIKNDLYQFGYEIGRENCVKYDSRTTDIKTR